MAVIERIDTQKFKLIHPQVFHYSLCFKLERTSETTSRSLLFPIKDDLREVIMKTIVLDSEFSLVAGQPDKQLVMCAELKVS